MTCGNDGFAHSSDMLANLSTRTACWSSGVDAADSSKTSRSREFVTDLISRIEAGDTGLDLEVHRAITCQDWKDAGRGFWTFNKHGMEKIYYTSNQWSALEAIPEGWAVLLQWLPADDIHICRINSKSGYEIQTVSRTAPAAIVAAGLRARMREKK